MHPSNRQYVWFFFKVISRQSCTLNINRGRDSACLARWHALQLVQNCKPSQILTTDFIKVQDHWRFHHYSYSTHRSAVQDLKWMSNLHVGTSLPVSCLHNLRSKTSQHVSSNSMSLKILVTVFGTVCTVVLHSVITFLPTAYSMYTFLQQFHVYFALCQSEILLISAQYFLL